MHRKVSERVKKGLEELCRNANLRLNLRLHEMGVVLEEFGMPGRLAQDFDLISSDPNAEHTFPGKVHACFDSFGNAFTRTYNLTAPKKGKMKGKMFHHLLVDIVLGENHVRLFEGKKEDIKSCFPIESERLKYFHSLRHGLFVREDMALREIARDPYFAIDVAKKFIANMEYCRQGLECGRSKYSSSSCLVTLAGAYSTIITEQIGAGEPVNPEDVEEFIRYLDETSKAAADERADKGAVGRIHSIGKKVSQMLFEVQHDGWQDYNSRIEAAMDVIPERGSHRKKRSSANYNRGTNRRIE